MTAFSAVAGVYLVRCWKWGSESDGSTLTTTLHDEALSGRIGKRKLDEVAGNK
jgi:hypothetical protein